jgi:anthranilate phosphoribosyltransferase
VIEIRDGATREWSVDPRRLGMAAASEDDLAGGGPADNARIGIEVLSGGGAPGARAAVALNAGAALYVAGEASSFEEGVERAAAALAEGRGMAALARLRTATAGAAAS